jgi:hypothetical protein
MSTTTVDGMRVLLQTVIDPTIVPPLRSARVRTIALRAIRKLTSAHADALDVYAKPRPKRVYTPVS